MVEIRTHVLRNTGGEMWIEDAGPLAGFPVLVHAGSPGSRRLFRPTAEHAAAEHGLRLISYDRPGYGNTPARPGRAIADGAEDTRAIAIGLGLTRLAVWGFSGGGAYALACAALLPDLVPAACVFASLAPRDAEGLDFSAGWPDEYRQEVSLFFEHRDLAREHWRAEADELYAVLSTPEGWLARWGTSAGTDAAHGRDVAEYLAAVQRDCLEHGDQGWWDDWAATLNPWGFDLGGIRVPVQLWHGERDTAVPPGHGHWLAAHIPGAEAHFIEADDHTNIEANHQCQAYEWLRRRVDE
jgi:pimeloyl-ACP methyl ester carboxylesterase